MSQLRLTLPADVSGSHDEDVMINEFQNLKESIFLKKHMLIFISLTTTMGIIGCFFKQLYAFIPVYENLQCSYYYETLENWIYTTNIYSYLFLNWTELLILVIICFIIRNVKDELSIISELLLISGFWIISSFIYFLLVCLN